MQDIIEATCVLLKADADVAGELSDRVYGGKLPAGEAGAQPRPTVVVQHAPGATGLGDYAELELTAIEVVCYGESEQEADYLRRLVAKALKQAPRQVVTISDGTKVLVHRYAALSSPSPYVDPDTKGRYLSQTWEVMASEVAVV